MAVEEMLDLFITSISQAWEGKDDETEKSISEHLYCSTVIRAPNIIERRRNVGGF